ncbi:MAG TPA: hypothetical protein VIS06_20585 [Mycobacteriales bacterium]
MTVATATSPAAPRPFHLQSPTRPGALRHDDPHRIDFFTPARLAADAVEIYRGL